MYNPIKISDFLHRKKEPIKIEPNKEYSLVTVRLHHKGVVLREREKGSLLGSNMYKITKGQFILSGIDARNGAFGIVPDELDGAIVTNDFWYFDVDETKVKRDFFYWLTNTPLFLDACQKSSKGETQRIRLQKDLFFNFELHLPQIDKQEEFLNRFSTVEKLLSGLKNEQINQSSYFFLLRQSILQEAIEGKLTAEWRKNNPVREGDPEYDARALLEKIKEEKERMIAEGKIKKQKPLAPIKPEDVPFELPEGWVWTNYFMISSITGGKRLPHGYSFSKNITNHIYIRIVDMKNGSINDTDLKYIDEEVFKRISKYIIAESDIYITIAGTIGQVGLVPSKFNSMNLTENAARVSPYFVDKKWLYYFTSAKSIQKQFSSYTKGMAQPKLALFRIQKSIIPLPALIEQRAIVERVDHLLGMVDELEKQVEERKERGEDLMQSVLRKAFGGRK